MKKLRITFAVLILAVCTLGGLPARAQLAVGQDLSDRIEVNTVNVEVSVSDKNGRPVTGLQRRDFELREDGKPVQIANFDAVAHHAALANAPEASGEALPRAPESATEAAEGFAEPASWVVYIDDAFIAPASRARVLGQLREFLTGKLAPGDQVMVASYDLGLRIRLPFTKDRESLAWALDQVAHVTAKGGELERARHHILAELLSEQESASMLTGKKGPKLTRAHDQEVLPDDEGGGPGGASGCPQSVPQSAKSYAAALRQQVLSSVDGLTLLVNSLSGLPGRKVVLHVSDGIPATPGEEIFEILVHLCGDSGSALSGRYFGNQAALDAQDYSTVPDWTALAAHANAQRVTLYTFQASGTGAGGMAADMGPEDQALNIPSVVSIESANRQQTLSVLASETGGRAVFWANDIRSDLARVQEDLGSYYSLGFNPSHFGDGREHRISLKVKRPGVTLRYRQSYRDKPALERVVDRTLSSAFYGYEDNPLDIRMEVGQIVANAAETAGGTWKVPVRLRIPLFKLGLQTRQDMYEGKLRLLVVVREPKGGSSPLRQVEIPLHIPHNQALTALGQSYLYDLTLTLKAGEQNLAVAVRDETTTTTSYLARTLHIGTVESR
jgi:VWFA-related protein